MFESFDGESVNLVTEWRRQIKEAEENGSFCFTSIPVLTEAILDK